MALARIKKCADTITRLEGEFDRRVVELLAEAEKWAEVARAFGLETDPEALKVLRWYQLNGPKR